MGSFVPLLLALVAIEVFRHQTPTADLTTMLVAVASAPVLMLLLGELAARFIVRRGSRRLLLNYDLLAQSLSVGWFFAVCAELQWASWAGGYTLALVPWLLTQMALWWSATPAWRAASGHPWTRAGFVVHHLRFDLAPVLVAAPVLDLCEMSARWLGTDVWFQGPAGTALGLVGALLLMLTLIILLPWLLARLWGARRLPAGALATALSEDCRRAGIPDARLLSWPSPGGRVHNALAMGLLPRQRYVMFSDDLMQDLTQDELRAVLGHELGHIRHGHLTLYLLFVALSMMASYLLLGELLGSHDALGQALPVQFGLGEERIGLLFQIPGIEAIPAVAVISAAIIVKVLIFGRWLFGHVSRACERQADLAGALAVGDPRIMAQALRRVAQLSGTREDAPSWRHHSIGSRIAFLEQVAADPGLANLHHRVVAGMRLQLLLVLALLASLAVGIWFNPTREAATTDTPGAELATMASKDHDLGDALVAADRGDTGPLTRWMTRADELQRQRLARLQLRTAEIPGKGRPHPDRQLWNMRHRLVAMSPVPTGDPRLDLDLDNSLAYALVAGTRDPDPRDIDRAKEILPRLEKILAARHDHGLMDTVACIHFAMREWETARKGWESALQQLAEVSGIQPARRSEAEALYRRRMDTAQGNQQVATGRRPAPYLPLPLAFDPNLPETP